MSHPLGFYAAVAGGIVAQSPDPSVGVVGLIIAATGLIGGLTQLLGKYADYRQQMRRLDAQEDRTNQLAADLQAATAKLHETEAKLAETGRELEESRVRGHDRDDHTASVLNVVQERIQKNSETLQVLVPATKELAERSGITAAIPDPSKPVS